VGVSQRPLSYRANGVPDHQRNAFWKQAA